MSPSGGRLRKVATRLVVVGLLLLCFGLLAATGAAGRAPALKPLAAAVDVTQTCSTRVPRNSRINVRATLSNPGTEQLVPTTVDADAGTPENTADDFNLTRGGGDNNGNNLLDPGENWTYTGSYTAGTEDVTNNVGAEAVSVLGGTPVNDIAPCETDVIQEPVAGVIVRVNIVQGNVTVKRPGASSFVRLSRRTEIPVGSWVNTVNGRLRLTTALGRGRTNTADFYAGVFRIFQRRARNAYTTIRLEGGNFRSCRRGKAQSVDVAGASRRPIRRVWGRGKGRFTTRGRYSSATVRGTRWLTQDQCNGTLTRVLRGIVLVRDFRLKKNVLVRAGHSYLSKAP